MAMEEALERAESGRRTSRKSRAEDALQAAAAIESADAAMKARHAASDARAWVTRAARSTSTVTLTLTRSTLHRLRALALRAKDDGARTSGRRAELAGGLPWLVAGGASWLVFSATQSWAQAAIAGTCLFALLTLSAMHNAQRLESHALREQLAELRLSLRVAQALLEVESVEDAVHLDDELDDARASGTRRLPRQRVSRPHLG